MSGIWVGVTSESCSHLIVNSSGVFKARSIRRRPVEEQFQLSEFSSCKAVPWNVRGDGIVDQKFLMPEISDFMRSVMADTSAASSSSKPFSGSNVQERDIEVKLTENKQSEKSAGTLSGVKRKPTFITEEDREPGQSSDKKVRIESGGNSRKRSAEPIEDDAFCNGEVAKISPNSALLLL